MSDLLQRLLRSLHPHSLPIARREMLRATLGATLALLCTSFISLHLANYASTHHWLVASFGASALLLFLVPSSPLAQPWNVLVGNTLSVLIGICCARWIPSTILALTLAGSLSMGLMLLSRSVHPPSVAMSIFPALHGIHDFNFALFPVLTDSSILLVLAVLYNNLTGVPYPAWYKTKQTVPPVHKPERFTDADFDAALEYYKQSLNVSREDLQKLLSYVHTIAFQRNLGTKHCSALMNANAPYTYADTSLEEAWAILQEHNTKALAVLDKQKKVIGILTQADFLRRLNLQDQQGLRQRLRHFVQTRRDKRSVPVVADIMSSPALCAQGEHSITELIPLFSHEKHRHLPVVDEYGHYLGLITQSDLMVALYDILRPDPYDERQDEH